MSSLYRSSVASPTVLALVFFFLFVLPRCASAQYSTGGTWRHDERLIGSTVPEGYVTPNDTSIAKFVSAWALAYGVYGDDQRSKIRTQEGTIVYNLQWQPKNNDAYFDPIPPTVLIAYRCHAQVSTYTDIYPDGQTIGDLQASALATATLGDAHAVGGSIIQGLEVQSEGQDDTDVGEWQYQVLPVYGTGGANLILPFSLKADTHEIDIDSIDFPYPARGHKLNSAYGYADAKIWVEVYVVGKDMGRNNGGLGTALDGATSEQNSDPTYTRWLPLAFSPKVSSQPFYANRTGILPAPWGNVNCAYSINIRRETNPEINGTGSYYLPPGVTMPFPNDPGHFIFPSSTYQNTKKSGTRLRHYGCGRHSSHMG